MLRANVRMRGMAKANKREFIKVGQVKAIINVGKFTNNIHIDLVLTVDQEKRLLKMLRERAERRPRRRIKS
jgi:hypothetical protein